MGIVNKIKSNISKFVPTALKKRFGMARRRGHARKHRR
jgi:hypothetical protein